MTTKSLQSMAAPLMVSFTLRFLFAFVDMAYAAMLPEGKIAVAAITLYVPLSSVYIAVWVGLSAGFTACLSKAFGHRDDDRVRQLKRSLLRILAGLIPCLLMLGAGVYVVVPYLDLEPRLAATFRTYASTLAIGLPLVGFWSIYPDSIVKAHQDTRSTMIAGLLSSVTNVGLNTLFVFAFGWGIFGIALATVVSRIAGLIYAMHRARVLERDRDQADWSRADPIGWPAPIPTILALAVPGALTHLLNAVEGSVIVKVLADLPDAITALASFGVYNQVLMLAMMPAAGASVAVVPYVAMMLPSRDLATIRRDIRHTMRLILGLALIITIGAGWLFAEPLAVFFLEGGEASAATPSAVQALRLLPLAALAGAPFFMLRPVFEAAHRPKIGIQVSVARFVLLSVPLIFAGRYLAPAVGLPGLIGVISGVTIATTLAALWAARLARRVLAEAV